MDTIVLKYYYYYIVINKSLKVMTLFYFNTSLRVKLTLLSHYFLSINVAFYNFIFLYLVVSIKVSALTSQNPL